MTKIYLFMEKYIYLIDLPFRHYKVKIHVTKYQFIKQIYI